MNKALNELIEAIEQHPEMDDHDKHYFVEMINYRTRNLDVFYLVYQRISPCLDQIKNCENVPENKKVTWEELAALRDVVSLMRVFDTLNEIKLLHSEHGAYELYQKVETCFAIAHVLGLDDKHDVPGMRFFQYNHRDSREFFYDTIALFEYLHTLIKPEDHQPIEEHKPSGSR